MPGWIKIHRQIQDCFIWKEKPYDKARAWIDLLLSANHRDKKLLIDNDVVVIARGSYMTSTVKLADRWGWSRNKVLRFLNVLESEQMLNTKRTQNGTLITIVKYDDFQCSDTADETTYGTTNGTADETSDRTSDRTADETQNKNIRIKEIKNEKNIKEIFFENPDLEIAFKDYVSMRSKIKKPMTKNAIERMIKKVNRLSGGNDAIAIEILNKSTDKCWTDIYELKYDDLKKITSDKKTKDELHTEQIEEELVGDDW